MPMQVDMAGDLDMLATMLPAVVCNGAHHSASLPAPGFRATLHSLVGQPGPGRARAQDQAVQRRVVLGPLLSLVLTLHTGSLAPDAAQPGPDAAHWQPGAGRCTAWSWARKGTEK
jgi:hypothetical protein